MITNVKNVKKDSMLQKKLNGNVLLVWTDAHIVLTLKHVTNVMMTDSINGMTQNVWTLCAILTIVIIVMKIILVLNVLEITMLMKIACALNA